MVGEAVAVGETASAVGAIGPVSGLTSTVFAATAGAGTDGAGAVGAGTVSAFDTGSRNGAGAGADFGAAATGGCAGLTVGQAGGCADETCAVTGSGGFGVTAAGVISTRAGAIEAFGAGFGAGVGLSVIVGASPIGAGFTAGGVVGCASGGVLSTRSERSSTIG